MQSTCPRPLWASSEEVKASFSRCSWTYQSECNYNGVTPWAVCIGKCCCSQCWIMTKHPKLAFIRALMCSSSYVTHVLCSPPVSEQAHSWVCQRWWMHLAQSAVQKEKCFSSTAETQLHPCDFSCFSFAICQCNEFHFLNCWERHIRQAHPVIVLIYIYSMLCNLLSRVSAKAGQAINGDEQKVTLTVKPSLFTQFAECPVLVRKADGDFTKTPHRTSSALVSVTHNRMLRYKPTWLQWLVDTEVKEDAEQIAVSLAILQDGPIDLLRSNNPLDCLGSLCTSGCYNPSGDSHRCAPAHSSCLTPQHPVLRLFGRAHVCPSALSLLVHVNAA